MAKWLKQHGRRRGLSLVAVMLLLFFTTGCGLSDEFLSDKSAGEIVDGILSGIAESELSENTGQESDELLAEDSSGIGADEADDTALGQEQSSSPSGDENDITAAERSGAPDGGETLDPDGSYTSKEDVSLYLYTYQELPDNFMTKQQARALGWQGGSLEPYAPGMCIGGDRFGNYEGLLPEENGREYRECDIDTLGQSSRGAKRIVYSDDGLIYYTEDHYASFELLYE